MRSMEFSGHSVDEAIYNGLNEMGVTIDEVEIETIQSESKGLFGIGAKQAVVRLTQREVPLVMEMEQVYRKEQEATMNQRRDQSQRGGGRPERRDISERGRDIEGIKHQILATVLPMYETYVKPTQKNAHFSINWEGEEIPGKATEGLVRMMRDHFR